MSNETEKQIQTGILEHPEEQERRLTPEAERVIRDHLTRRFTLPGIVLVVISFVIGFFIDRVAFQAASNQAFLSAQSEVMKLVREVVTAKFEVDEAAKAIQVSSSEIRKSEEKAKKFAEELTSLQSKLDSTVAFQASNVQIREIADVLARDPRILKVLSDLGDSIQARVTKTDQEVEKIRTSYKIECLESKVGQVQGDGTVFVFPFVVRHAWIELSQYMDEPHRVWIAAINNRSVVVTTTDVKTLRNYEQRAKERERMLHPTDVAYRVWATSF